ncbi:putative structural protein [Erwinia phage vB_EamM_TropicalSun]|uniref:Tail fiber protein n=2 Tax=Myosmarvirus TaxID=2843428 RepID=A0AAU7VHA0_9CAUD|nr:putative structural protein [Erwinia phage vB_EamM_TropicalSun]
MANSILGSLIRMSSFTMTSDNGPVNLTGITIANVSIKFNSRTLKNRREDGTVIAHARIKTPVQVQVKAIASNIDGLQVLSHIMKNIDIMYEIKTRGVQIKNLKLQRSEQTQSAESLSATPIMLTFAGIQMQGTYRPVCVQQGDSSVIDSGISTLKNVTQSVEDFANGISDALGGVL